MRHSIYNPAAPLGDYVDVFWECLNAPPHPRAIVLPNGTIELVINLADDEIRIYDAKRPDSYQTFPGIVVSGAHAGSFVVDPSQRRSIMGVHFRPGGAFAVLGPALRDLADTHVALEDLWGTSATEFRERLCAAVTPHQRFQIVEKTLLARLRWTAEHPAVLLGLRLFGSRGTGCSVRDVAKRAGLSQRRLIEVFRSQVGLTPKRFCRVLRFKHAREVAEQVAIPDWSEVALACGYYDQSHLIHEFQELSGFTPTQFLQLPRNPLARNHVRQIG